MKSNRAIMIRIFIPVDTDDPFAWRPRFPFAFLVIFLHDARRRPDIAS